jgi:peptide/nickel transport system permease protein
MAESIARTQETTAAQAARPSLGPPLSYLRGFWRFMRNYPVVPLFILSALVVSAVIGPWVAPYPRDIGELPDRHLAPFTRSEATGNFYVLGTDHVGRDMFTRLLFGSRISLVVVSVALLCGSLVGITFGIVSGYFGGITDEVITRFVDIWYAMPFLLTALILTLIFGRGLPVLVVVLALLAWTGFVRVLRAQVLVLRELDYVNSARICGASNVRIILRHILPGVLNTAIVIATLNTAGLFLAESVLSFVGAGIQPPTPAWGVMVNDGRDYIEFAWWQTIVPGTCIFLVVISLNFTGDWLRDKLDPRLRQLA